MQHVHIIQYEIGVVHISEEKNSIFQFMQKGWGPKKNIFPPPPADNIDWLLHMPHDIIHPHFGD